MIHDIHKFLYCWQRMFLAFFPNSAKWSRLVVSDSLSLHGLSPTRLLRPWDFPGKSTGVGCHFLLQKFFLTQGSNPGLLHCRQTLYRLSHQGIFAPNSAKIWLNRWLGLAWQIRPIWFLLSILNIFLQSSRIRKWIPVLGSGEHITLMKTLWVALFPKWFLY